MKDFIANNIDQLASIDYGDLHEELSTAKVGQLAFKFLSADIDTRDRELEQPKLYSMISNANFPLRDGADIEYRDVEVGIQDEIEFQATIDSMISSDEKQLSKNSNLSLVNLVYEFKDVFRRKLGKDPPVDIKPMQIEFEGVTRPVKVRQRTCSPEKLEFLKTKV